MISSSSSSSGRTALTAAFFLPLVLSVLYPILSSLTVQIRRRNSRHTTAARAAHSHYSSRNTTICYALSICSALKAKAAAAPGLGPGGRGPGGRSTLTCSRSFPLPLLPSFVRSFFRSFSAFGRTDGASSSSSWAVRSSFPVPPLPPLASPFTYSPSPSSVRAPHRSVRAWSTYIFTIHP